MWFWKRCFRSTPVDVVPLYIPSLARQSSFDLKLSQSILGQIYMLDSKKYLQAEDTVPLLSLLCLCALLNLSRRST